ncbi:hypothetical protein WJ03_30080 [Burkholderia vietnamiensis]|nr:hypothetical protein WJ03_30080 [Burkholderia vietnamiensis]
MEAGCKSTAYAVEQRFDALRMVRVPNSEGWPAIQWQRYADGGVTPGDETMQRVEQVLPTTRDTFITGPKSESGVAPLWLALGGPLDGVRAVLNWYDERLWELHLAGAPFERMMYAVTDAVFPRDRGIARHVKTYLEIIRDLHRDAITKGFEALAIAQASRAEKH